MNYFQVDKLIQRYAGYLLFRSLYTAIKYVTDFTV